MSDGLTAGVGERANRVGSGEGRWREGRWRVRHLPVPMAACGVLAVLAAVVGGLAGGPAGALGATAGVCLVTLGYLGSTLMIAWADSVAPALVMPFGLMAYLVKISLVAAVFTVAAAGGWAGLVPMAWAVAAGVVCWTAAHIWWLLRHSRPNG